MTTLERMLDGNAGLEALLAAIRLPEAAIERLDADVSKVLSRQGSPGPDVLAEAPQGGQMALRGVAVESAHALTPAEIDAFARRGVAGPFPLLSSDEAADMRAYVLRRFDEDFGGHHAFTDEIKAIFQKYGAWRLNTAGLYQALFDPEIAALHARPEITDRLAGLLGPDLQLWRSQMFVAAPGSPGTFWHQASRFREQAAKAKLTPTQDVDPAALQLTVWVALEPVTVRNSCLRFLPGSFHDGRLERFTYGFLDDVEAHLQGRPVSSVRDALKVIRYQPDIFKKAELAFHEAVRRHPDLFEAYQAEDVEMQAGEFIVFSSMTLHASRPNVTDRPRIALAGRYTTPDVKVLGGTDREDIATPEGVKPWHLDRVGCLQVRGEDRFGFNRLKPMPTP